MYKAVYYTDLLSNAEDSMFATAGKVHFGGAVCLCLLVDENVPCILREVFGNTFLTQAAYGQLCLMLTSHTKKQKAFSAYRCLPKPATLLCLQACTFQ